MKKCELCGKPAESPGAASMSRGTLVELCWTCYEKIGPYTRRTEAGNWARMVRAEEAYDRRHQQKT